MAVHPTGFSLRETVREAGHQAIGLVGGPVGRPRVGGAALWWQSRSGRDMLQIAADRSERLCQLCHPACSPSTTLAEAPPRRLAKTLRRWRAEILTHHATGASNGPVEAANLLIEHVKRASRGFRTNYRLRIVLAGGLQRDAHNVTRLRARPTFVS